MFKLRDFIIISVLIVSSAANAEGVELSCGQVRELVDGHNAYRLQLARGQVKGQPKAADMQTMVWDDELADKAQKYANEGKFQHNPDREIKSKRFITGENLYLYQTTSLRTDLNMTDALASWFNEQKDFQYSKISRRYLRSRKQVGHYTQMVWANSVYVGCGVNQKLENGWTVSLYVCNYGPAGNYIGRYPYKTGKGCENLCCTLANCSKKYGCKC